MKEYLEKFFQPTPSGITRFEEMANEATGRTNLIDAFAKYQAIPRELRRWMEKSWTPIPEEQSDSQRAAKAIREEGDGESVVIEPSEHCTSETIPEERTIEPTPSHANLDKKTNPITIYFF